MFGDRDPKTITRRDIEAWKLGLLNQRQDGEKSHNKGEPYSHGTLLTAWTMFRALLNVASIEADCVNPMLGLKFDIDVASKKDPKAALTADEVGRVIKAAETGSPDIRAMLMVGFATGMRFCELSALEWRDIDLDRGTARIERSQVYGCVGPPKTEATRRLCYFPPEVVEALRLHQEWQVSPDGHRSKLEGRDLLFPSTNGLHRNPAILRKPLATFCKLAGVNKHLTSHCLRKTTNNLVRQSSGDVVARAIVGHSKNNEAMTFLYSDVDATERSKAHRAAFGEALVPTRMGTKRGDRVGPHENLTEELGGDGVVTP